MTVVQRRGQPTRGHRDGVPSIPGQNEFDGLTDYPRPESEIPRLPDDLTALDDVQLIQLLSALTAWYNFSARKLSEAEVEYRRREVAYNEAAADALVMAWGAAPRTTKDSVTVVKAARDQDPKVRAQQQEELNAYAVRKRLEVRTEAFERDAFVVSRELTRRTKMEPFERRDRRWGTG